MSGIPLRFSGRQLRELAAGHLVFPARDGGVVLRPADAPPSHMERLAAWLAGLPVLRSIRWIAAARELIPLEDDEVICALRASLDRDDRLDLLAQNALAMRGPVPAVAAGLVAYFTALNTLRLEGILNGLRLQPGSGLREAVAQRTRQRFHEDICIRSLDWDELRTAATEESEALSAGQVLPPAVQRPHAAQLRLVS